MRANQDLLTRELLAGGGRVLVIGAPGAGKSTLVTAMADAAEVIGEPAAVITADPGRPLFGPPGAVSLGARCRGQWQIRSVEGLATLDCARFRLPLIAAVNRLAALVHQAALVVDAPGVFRGMAGGELLFELARAARAGCVLVLERRGEAAGVLGDLRASGAELRHLKASGQASRPSQSRRIATRTAAWDEWLRGATEASIDLDSVCVTGSPPPRMAPDEWAGRQVVLRDRSGGTLAMGEVQCLEGTTVSLRSTPFDRTEMHTLVIRDARRDGDGKLRTARQWRERSPAVAGFDDRAITLPRPRGGCAAMLRGELVGGLFGDPLVLLRLTGTGRCVLIDLGEHPQLPVRVARRVSDVFLSHAHMDHVAGFPWLLRRRVGITTECRIVGPPGTCERVAAFVGGFTWDRIGDQGPRFEIAELYGTTLRRWRLQAGNAVLPEPLVDLAANNHVVHAEPGFSVQAAVLDHGTPVLAYAFQEDRRPSVRRQWLEEMGMPEGPWLEELKRLMLAGKSAATIRLPDGVQATVSELAADLLFDRPGQKLVYATDVADTPHNREALIDLARGAQLLVCEAAFLVEHRNRARETGHLTARACGEIAAAAAVERVLPFHLSNRYKSRPQAVFEEVREACDAVWLPPFLQSADRSRKLARSAG